jgi:hypothetical protein
MINVNKNVISIRIDSDDYNKLVEMQTKQFPSVSAIIRDLIRIAIYPKTADVKPVELKPLEPLQNPVNMELIKEPLEIPVVEVSSVTESASLVHKLERTFQPQMRDVIIAKRAKEFGRPYDKNLEPFFKDING